MQPGLLPGFQVQAHDLCKVDNRAVEETLGFGLMSVCVWGGVMLLLCSLAKSGVFVCKIGHSSQTGCFEPMMS